MDNKSGNTVHNSRVNFIFTFSVSNPVADKDASTGPESSLASLHDRGIKVSPQPEAENDGSVQQSTLELPVISPMMNFCCLLT